MANAIRKYGRESFTVVELGRASSIDELNEMEKRAIWSHSSTDKEYGYNIQIGGSSVGPPSWETRRKMSESGKRKKLSPEHRAAIGRGVRGKNPHTWTAESRAKLSASKKGRSWTPEMREAILAGLLKPETKAKMTASAIRRSKAAQRRLDGTFMSKEELSK